MLGSVEQGNQRLKPGQNAMTQPELFPSTDAEPLQSAETWSSACFTLSSPSARPIGAEALERREARLRWLSDAKEQKQKRGQKA